MLDKSNRTGNSKTLTLTKSSVISCPFHTFSILIQRTHKIHGNCLISVVQLTSQPISDYEVVELPKTKEYGSAELVEDSLRLLDDGCDDILDISNENVTGIVFRKRRSILF